MIEQLTTKNAITTVVKAVKLELQMFEVPQTLFHQLW